MLKIYIGTTDNELEVMVQETETVRAVYEREGKASLLSRDKISIKLMSPSAVKTLTTTDLNRTFADLGVADGDYIVVSENLKGAAK